jgi:transcriptional regulator with GAF, ATPase, and Fis domain
VNTEHAADEIQALRRCMNDLVSVLALPAMWTGHETSRVATTLLELLIRLLDLDFAYLRASDADAGSPLEWVRSAEGTNRAIQTHEVGRALAACVNHHAPGGSVRIASPFGNGSASIAVLHLGLQEPAVGVCVAGSQRTDFPTESERLLLQVATNQAAIALQEARLVRERRHATEELERRVVERTAELTAAFAEIQTLKERLQRENVALREEVEHTSMFEEIVGVSVSLRSLLTLVSKVAPTDSTALITGETGTGKELVARAIHKRSQRSGRPFVSVNCAAIPPSLIASELFGHEKGAFTGAVQRRQGRFELAEGGTIFLDEVGELPAETQLALLRVLQEREFERVGGSRPIRTDVRVIAATNRDLEAAVAETTFRADLFYRLNVFPLEVPPLRDRQPDIPLLVEYFTHRYAKRAGKRIEGISKQTLSLLQSYHWPGNIRELQNVVERAVIISDSNTLSIDERWLIERHPRPRTLAKSGAGTLASQEKDSIEAALMESKGRVAGPFGAAARLGVPSTTLESKIKALNIDKGRFKSA